MTSKWTVGIIAVICSAMMLSGGAMAAGKKGKKSKKAGEMEVVQSLERMMSHGRAIVTESQDLINDKDKGDKGFTGDFFANELAKKMKEEDHVDVLKGGNDSMAKADTAMLTAMKKVITDAQPVINMKGMGFKGFLPAVFARKSLEEFNQTSTIKGKVTARIYRNAKNAPDDWEKTQLEKFMKPDYPKSKPISEIVTLESGDRALRYIRPEYYTGKCLKCHGEPKGERDITGGLKEGFHDGDAGAALSFTIPIKK